MGKKIAMILDGFLPDKRVEREAISLVEAGHTVSLFCFGEKARWVKKDGIEVFEHPVSFLQQKASAIANDYPIYHWLMRSALRKFLAIAEPDIIHVHDITIYGAVLKLKANCIVVIDLHENRPEIMKYYPHLKRFPGKYMIDIDRWKRRESFFVKSADYAIVVTEEAKEDYRSLNSSITVVPNTVQKAEIESVKIDATIADRFLGKFVITYVGDLGIRRGIYDLLHALLHAKEEIENVLLVLVGDSSERKFYEEFVDEHMLKDYVLFEGHQPHEKLFSYIEASDIGVSPLKRNRHHDTTYANKIFQYMAMGKAQIVSDCLAQKRLVESTEIGLVYKSEDPKDLAKCISEIYNDEKLKTKFEQNAKDAFDQEFNWENKRKDLVSLYSSF